MFSGITNKRRNGVLIGDIGNRMMHRLGVSHINLNKVSHVGRLDIKVKHTITRCAETLTDSETDT